MPGRIPTSIYTCFDTVYFPKVFVQYLIFHHATSGTWNKTLSWHNHYNKYWPGARYSIFIQMFFCFCSKIHRICTFHVPYVLTLYTFFGPERKYSWLAYLLKLSCRYFFFSIYIVFISMQLDDSLINLTNFFPSFLYLNLSSNVLMKKWMRLGVGVNQGPYIYLDP